MHLDKETYTKVIYPALKGAFMASVILAAMIFIPSYIASEIRGVKDVDGYPVNLETLSKGAKSVVITFDYSGDGWYSNSEYEIYVRKVIDGVRYNPRPETEE